MKRLDVHSLLRKLAKSPKYQNLFGFSKECQSFKVFRNIEDLSRIQTTFISWLYFYSNLYLEVAKKEVTKTVLEDDICADAYGVWKSQENIERKKDTQSSSKNLKVVFGSSNKIKFPKR
jgi:hypothetical protein